MSVNNAALAQMKRVPGTIQALIPHWIMESEVQQKLQLLPAAEGWGMRNVAAPSKT